MLKTSCNCPPASSCQPITCDVRRAAIDGTPFITTLGATVVFLNQLRIFQDAETACTGVGSNLITIADLNNSDITTTIAEMLSVPTNNCPIVIWATSGGEPTLVEVNLQDDHAVTPVPFYRIIDTTDLFCLAYTICVTPA